MRMTAGDHAALCCRSRQNFLLLPIRRSPSTEAESFFPLRRRKVIAGRYGRWPRTDRGRARSHAVRAIAFEPKYLPQNQIVYTFVSGIGAQRVSAVYVSRIDGTDAHPITFGPGNFQVETVLRSGRILVSAESQW